MSKAADALRAIKIFNPHDAARLARDNGGVGVYLSYRPRGDSRMIIIPGWQVIRPGFKTDPEAHWADYGHKTFGDTEAERVKAVDWASSRYGVEEWVKIPGLPRSLFPKQDAEIIKQALKDAKNKPAEEPGGFYQSRPSGRKEA